MSIEAPKTILTERDIRKQLQEMNEQLLVSSVRQHELAEGAAKAEKRARNSERRLAESQMRLAIELAATQKLQEISTQLIGEEDPDALYEKILDASVETMRAQYASIQMFHPERGNGGELRLRCYRGFSPEAAEFWEWVNSASETAGAAALRTGQRVIVDNIEAADWMAGSRDLEAYLQAGIHAVQSTPLLSRSGRLVGMLSTHWSRPHQPSERDLRLLDVLARQAADLIESAQAIEALRASEERYRHLVEQTVDGIFVADDEGRFRDVNPAGCEMLGMTLEEVLASSLPDILFPEEHARVPAAVAAFADGSVHLSEWSLRRKDGSSFVGELAGRELPDGRLQCVVRDITDRRQAEQQLHRTAETLSTLIEQSPVGIYTVDSHFRVAQISVGAMPAFRNVQPVIGRDFAEVMRFIWPEPFASEAISIFRHTLETGESYISAGLTEKRRDLGSTESYEWQVNRVMLADGNYGVVCYYFDTTRIRQAEQALRENEERLEFTLETARAGDWDMDLLTGKAQCSFRHDQCFGATEPIPDWNYEKFLSYVHPDDRAKEDLKFKEAVASGNNWNIECRVVWPDGSIHWIESSGMNYRFVEGKPTRMLGMVRDITEREYHKRRVTLLAVIGEMTQVIGEPSELLFAVSRAVGEHFNARRCLFNEIDLENDVETVERDYCRGVESVAGKHKISVYSPIMLAEMRAGRTVVNSDSKTDPRTAKFYEKTYAPADERSYVAVPLMRDGIWTASLWVSDDKPRDWSDPDVHLLESIGERVWLAVQKLRSDAALRESEERFAKAFNSSPLAITITSLKTGQLVEVNETFVNLTGYNRAEAIGRTTAELGLWAESADRDAELQAVTGNGHIRNAEYNFRMKDGTAITGLLSAELIELGGERCALTVIQDITERNRVEEALRESEEKFRTLSEAAPALIWFDDAEGNCRYVNQQYLDFSGKKLDELEGTGWHLVLHPEDEAIYIADFRAAQREQRSFNRRFRVRRHDGAWRWLESFARPLLGADGTFLGHVGISPDITDSVEAEEELKRAREDLEIRVKVRTKELAQTNSKLRHEIADRKQAQEQRIDLLRRIVTTQEDERRRIARDIHDHLGQRVTAMRLKIASLTDLGAKNGELSAGIERLQELGSLLDSEVGSLAWELRPPQMDEEHGLIGALQKYVNEWSRHFETAAEFHSRGFSSCRAGAEIETNFYRITQEAMNNIAKHAEATRVNVLLEGRNKEIILIIEDDGKGFEPSTDRVARASGMGLGLIGMRERATLLGGTLEIETAPRKGTTIFVRVPVVWSGDEEGDAD